MKLLMAANWGYTPRMLEEFEALGAELVFQRGALGLGFTNLLLGGLARGAFRFGAGIQIGFHLKAVGGLVGELALRFRACGLGLLLAYGELLFEGATLLLRLAGERFGGLAGLAFGFAAGLEFRLDLRAALRFFGSACGGLLGGGSSRWLFSHVAASSSSPITRWR